MSPTTVASPYIHQLPPAPRRAASPAIADIRPEELVPVPITPEDVLEGTPIARGARLSDSSDRRLSTNIWDCTAGTFRWYFSVDEIIHVLDGFVRVHDQDGRVHELRPGDVAHFPIGTTTVWEVPERVRKLAILRGPSQAFHARAWRKLKRTLSGAHRPASLAPLAFPPGAENVLVALPV